MCRNSGDLGSIAGLGWSPGGGHGNPLQYSCLENPMERGAWWATVHGVAESETTEWLSAAQHAIWRVLNEDRFTEAVNLQTAARLGPRRDCIYPTSCFISWFDDYLSKTTTGQAAFLVTETVHKTQTILAITGLTPWHQSYSIPPRQAQGRFRGKWVLTDHLKITPATEGQIKKMWYVSTVEYYSAIKKWRNNPIGSNMDGPRDCHTDWSKPDRKGQIYMILLMCGI